jgi:hypothetical protein
LIEETKAKPFELLSADISDEELAEALLPVKKSKAKKAKADIHAI